MGGESPLTHQGAIVAHINAYPFTGEAYQIILPSIPRRITIEPDGALAVNVYVAFPQSQADLRFGMNLKRLDYDGLTIWSTGEGQCLREPTQVMDGWAKLGDGYVHPMGVT